MRVISSYSFKGGEEYIKRHHANEPQEIYDAISNLNGADALCKISAEKTMKGKLLYSPEKMNYDLKAYLHERDWTEANPAGKKGFREPRISFGKGRFREMDGIKNKVGLEVQFGKYAFMGYDIFSKMIIFKNHGLIDCGIEVVATQALVNKMSTGVSAFEQLMIDFEHRGESNIDIPVLVLGIALTEEEEKQCEAKHLRFLQHPEEIMEKESIKYKINGSLPGPKQNHFEI